MINVLRKVEFIILFTTPDPSFILLQIEIGLPLFVLQCHYGIIWSSVLKYIVLLSIFFLGGEPSIYCNIKIDICGSTTCIGEICSILVEATYINVICL